MSSHCDPGRPNIHRQGLSAIDETRSIDEQAVEQDKPSPTASRRLSVRYPRSNSDDYRDNRHLPRQSQVRVYDDRVALNHEPACWLRSTLYKPRLRCAFSIWWNSSYAAISSASWCSLRIITHASCSRPCVTNQRGDSGIE